MSDFKDRMHQIQFRKEKEGKGWRTGGGWDERVGNLGKEKEGREGRGWGGGGRGREGRGGERGGYVEGPGNWSARGPRWLSAALPI